MIEFGLLGAQELAPRRGIEEQVADFHAGADRMRRRLHARLHVAALGFHLPGLLGVGGARGHGQARYRADRSQRLAAEAQAHHPLQVFQLADLAGGVARQGQRQVVGRNAAAIVTYAQELDATLLHFDVDAPGAGIQAVFQEFLDHRGGSFDHLARGDLVGQPRTQQLDTAIIGHCCTASAVPGTFRTWPTRTLSVFSSLALRSADMLTS
ncbi:hypothetical protein D3C78_1129460 [compost metagenome]